MQNTGRGRIYDASGRAINLTPPPPPEPVGFAIVKFQKGHAPSKELLQTISRATHATVLAIPYEYEIMSGEIATKELASIHSAIHAILEHEAKSKSKRQEN